MTLGIDSLSCFFIGRSFLEERACTLNASAAEIQNFKFPTIGKMQDESFAQAGLPLRWRELYASDDFLQAGVAAPGSARVPSPNISWVTSSEYETGASNVDPTKWPCPLGFSRMIDFAIYERAR